jgi:DNA-binding transcriptional ArsR family regulator
MRELEYRTTRILKALGNPLRYRILARLILDPATPTDLAREFRRSLDAVSRNLGILRALDLVWYLPRGPMLIYRVKHDAVPPLLAAAEQCAGASRAADPFSAPSTTAETSPPS